MTTTTDFRALCAELLAALETEGYAHWTINPSEDPLVKRALTALATPPPEPPTEQKSSIDELIAGCKPLDPEMAKELTTEARWRLFGEQDSATPPPEPPTDEDLWAFWNNHDGPITAILRAALERWGHR